jgi:hypothetical protein
LIGTMVATGRRHCGSPPLEGTPVCSAPFAAPAPDKFVPAVSDICPPKVRTASVHVEPVAIAKPALDNNYSTSRYEKPRMDEAIIPIFD